MLKSIAALFLLTAFAGQTFHQAIIVLDYYTNTAAFAKNCENKARPMMHCNGKCQMMKKLREQEKKEQQNPERKLDNKTEIISCRSFFASLHIVKVQIRLTKISSYNFLIPQAEPADVFHPPALV